MGAAMSLLQGSAELDVERAYFFSGAPQMSLFGWDEDTMVFTLEPSAFVFRWHASLFGHARLSTEICSTGSSCGGVVDTSLSGEPIYALAAQTAPGTTAVVLTNYSEASRSVDVTGSAAGAYT